MERNIVLAGALSNDSALQTIDKCGNNIGASGTTAPTGALRNNNIICRLTVDLFEIDAETEDILRLEREGLNSLKHDMMFFTIKPH